MTQSNNPETGAIKYTYDANGNVTTKLDAKSVTTTYSYDALNRLTQKSYSSGDPTVTLTYDQAACLGQAACYNIDHRTTMTDAGGTENLAYDKMGRELIEIRTTNNITMSTVYGYDLAGDLTTLIYPSGRIINYTYDSAGRPSTAQDGLDNVTYAHGSCANGSSGNGVCYSPQGAISQMNNGSNLVSTYLFNKRLQPCWMYATTGTALATNTSCTATDSTVGNILDLKYCFYTWSSGTCPTSPANNNGNVIGVTNNRDTTRTQSFAYDQVNRILSGQTSSTSGGNCWGETYTYDQWANMYAIGAVSGYTGCTQENLSVTATANNQLSFGAQFGYDANGNTLTDGMNSYNWNAENEMTSGSGVGYTYDGDGNRLMKANQKIYWYGAGTEILDESDTTGKVTNEYVFFAGKRVAMSVNPVVQNASFETANGLSTQPCGSFNSGPIPAWTGSNAGSWAPCSSNYSSLPDGNVVVFSNGGTISQTLTNANFQPNTTYTLSVAVGHRADCCSSVNYTVALEAGSNVVASTNGSTSNITAGTFATVTVTYATGGTPPSGNIGVALTSAGDQVDFDDVQLGMSGTVPDRSIYFYAEDMLGTSRTIVADTQTSPCYDADFYPFGGERVITNTCPQNYKFEGKERDTETGDDDFGSRYYASRLGRWLSADWSSVPAPVPYANLTNPQTLNLYAMVSDNPESFADLDGHCPPCDVDDVSIELVDEVAKPLIEGAAKEGGALLSGIVGTIGRGVGVAGIILLNPTSTDQKTENEALAKRDAALSQQKQQQTEKTQEAQPEPEPSTEGAGAKKGGGRSEQKSNTDRVQSAKDQLADLRKQRDALKSKPNKTPADKEQLQKINNAINRQTSRMKKSETHSRKEKGQQQ